MNRIERAEDFFKRDYSCSQAILAAFGPDYGLDEQTAIKVGRGLGSGMGLGNTCGAVTGAIIALGLYQGDSGEKERDKRYQSYDLIRKFVREFEKRRGSIECRDLLGFDPATKEGLAEIQAKNLFAEVCPKFVKDAAEILEEMI